MDRSRLASWLRRLPRGAARVQVREAGELCCEVSLAAEEPAAELGAAMEDVAAGQGKTVSLTLAAVDSEGKGLARLVCRMRPNIEETDPSASNSAELVRILAAHSHSLTVTMVDSQRELVGMYGKLLGVLESRVRRAEDRADTSEDVAREALSLADGLAKGQGRSAAIGERLEGLLSAAIQGGVNGILPANAVPGKTNGS